MDDVIAAVEIALLIVLPLIVFYQAANMSPKSYIWRIMLLYLIWFATYALFHELCHVFGSWVTGAKIKGYQLIPYFWKGDYKTGYVNSDFENGLQSFVSPISPYLRDLIFLFTGFVVLRRRKITNSFVAGLVMILFVLSPLFDIFNNYFGFVLGARNDFNAISGAICYWGSHAIGLLFTLAAMVTFWKVFAVFLKQTQSGF